jgi:hypothetical protein
LATFKPTNKDTALLIKGLKEKRWGMIEKDALPIISKYV